MVKIMILLAPMLFLLAKEFREEIPSIILSVFTVLSVIAFALTTV